MSIRVLVVDDNAELVDNIREYLQLQNYSVESAASGSAALEMVQTRPYDLMVLDVGLPGIDGLALCQMLRAQKVTLPILMLTARDTIDDRVAGLASGADDYLIKPFALRELNACIGALLRRTIGAQHVLRVGDLELDCASMRAARAGKPLKLNPTCLKLLRELMLKSPAVVPRERLLTVGWGGETPPSDSLRTNLYLLRREIDRPFDRPLIHTQQGFGWSIADLGEDDAP